MVQFSFVYNEEAVMRLVELTDINRFVTVTPGMRLVKSVNTVSSVISHDNQQR